MEFEVSSPCLQDHNTAYHPELTPFSSQPHTIWFNNPFNILLPSMVSNPTSLVAWWSELYHVRFSLKGEDAHGDHGLGSWSKLGLRPPLAPQIHLSLGQRNRAYWASQPQKSVTLQPQPEGRETTKSQRTCGWGGGNFLMRAARGATTSVTRLNTWISSWLHLHAASCISSHCYNMQSDVCNVNAQRAVYRFARLSVFNARGSVCRQVAVSCDSTPQAVGTE